MDERRCPTANILGVEVVCISIDELHAELQSLILGHQHALVLNVNVNCLNLAHKYPWLLDFLNSAEIVFCDGVGIMLGARMLGFRIPERITYADWMWQLAGFAEEQDFSFYFLGARDGVADRAAAKLRDRFPDLRIVGTHHGYFDKSPDSTESDAVVSQINAVKPNILVLGFGMPLQERWLMRNWDRVEANIALTGGAVFDYIAGDLRRAPQWMTENGLEWMGRVIIEPRRLWKRYLLGNPIFLWRVLRQRMGMLVSP